MKIQSPDSLFLPPNRESSRTSSGTGSRQNFNNLLEAAEGCKSRKIRLGSISHETPTVGHLLAENPRYAGECWDIVHSEKNAHKPYTRMAEGTPVYLDPVTREISWPENAPVEKTTPACSWEDQSGRGPGMMAAIDAAIHHAAATHDISADLIRAVIRAESAFQPKAVSHAGAQGLMQLMPATARELGISDPFDIGQNIDGGARYLKQMLALFDGDLEKALAAYNAGPGTMRKSGEEIPYIETRAYVARVVSYLNKPS